MHTSRTPASVVVLFYRTSGGRTNNAASAIYENTKCLFVPLSLCEAKEQ